MTETAPQEQLAELALAWPDKAHALRITNQQSYDHAAQKLLAIKDLLAESENTFGPIQAKAHAAWKEVIAQRKRVEEPLASAESIIKRAIGAWSTEQERLRLEAEREARRAEELRQAEEIEAQALEAEASGASTEEVTAILDQPIFAPVAAAPTFQKASGIATCANYKARVTNKLALVKAATQDPRLLDLFVVNEAKLNAFAKAMGTAFKLPGCELYQETIVSARRN